MGGGNICIVFLNISNCHSRSINYKHERMIASNITGVEFNHEAPYQVIQATASKGLAQLRSLRRGQNGKFRTCDPPDGMRRTYHCCRTRHGMEEVRVERGGWIVNR